MGIAACDSCVSQNSLHDPELNRAVLMQRVCSSVMLLLSGATTLFLEQWNYAIAFVVYSVSLLATWLNKRWGGPIWAVFTSAGFGLWAWWQFGG